MGEKENVDLTSTDEFKNAKYAILDSVLAGLCFALLVSVPYYFYAFYRAITGIWWPVEWLLYFITVMLWMFFLKLGRTLLPLTKNGGNSVAKFVEFLPWSIRVGAGLFFVFLPMLIQLRRILT